MQAKTDIQGASGAVGEKKPQPVSHVLLQEKAIRVDLVTDLVLFAPIMLVAWLANSMVLLTDSLGFLNCIAFKTISLVILRRIRSGRAVHYEYGSDKIEVIGGVISACLMLGSAAVVLVMALGRIFRPEPVEATFSLVGIGFQVLCLGLSVWLWRRNHRIAKATSGPIMEATWRGNRADAIENGALIFALGLTLWLRPYAWSVYIDPVCALVALIYPTLSLVSLLRRSLGDLMDKTLEEELQFKILRRLARHFHQYDAFHKIKSRRAGRRVFIDIYLGFDGERRVSEVTGLIDQIQSGLAEDIPGAEVNVIVSRADLEKAPAAAKS